MIRQILFTSFCMVFGMGVGHVSASPKSKMLQKQLSVKAKKLKAALGKRAKLVASMKRLQKQHAKLRAQLKGVALRLRAVRRQLAAGGGTVVHARNAVRECKRRMRRTFSSSDSAAERRRLLKWCQDTYANVAVYVPFNKLKPQ